MGTPVVELLDAETDWTDKNVGRKRQDYAVAQGRTARHDAPCVGDEALAMHILGGRCEGASYKWAKPVTWNWFHFGREKKPDLHDFIDVKGVNAAHKNLVLNHDSDPSWAYLLVDGSEHPYYSIIGWCWGFEALAVPMTERTPGRPRHFVDRGDPLLKSPELLLSVLRERQQHPERSAADAAHQ